MAANPARRWPGRRATGWCLAVKPGHTGDDALVQALQEHVKATLAPYKYPRKIEFLDKLPRTETGKLQRYVLRQRAQGK